MVPKGPTFFQFIIIRYLWKINFGVFEPNSFSTVTYTYIDSLNPRGQVSSFKTLKIRPAQRWAANLTNGSKIKNFRCVFGGHPFPFHKLLNSIKYGPIGTIILLISLLNLSIQSIMAPQGPSFY